MNRNVKAWEKHRGCLLHAIGKAWECWVHEEKCPAIQAGVLVEAPW